MSSVIIIGGGAAGMAAAIAAASCGDSVILLERMDRVGRKLLATGNGRCNLMNTGAPRYPGGSKFAQAVLANCGVAEQERFWQHLGLRMRQEDGGRVYPVSGMASTVLDALRFAMEALHVEIVTGVQITGIFRARHGWTVMAGAQKWKAERVIAAGGGCAQPKLGSDGSIWPMMAALGHRVTAAHPALTQIITDTAPIKGLSGIRVRTHVAVTRHGVLQHEENGELLFADYGVTGVCIMQCARFVQPYDLLHIDLTKAMGFDTPAEFRTELLRRRESWAGREVSQLLTGLCVPKLAQALLHAAGLDRKHTCADIPPVLLDRLTAAAADFTLTVRGVKGFDSAQVAAGGADPAEFTADTLASRMHPGLHAAGEMLDVDGDCGGFNLMFAFASGILAGLNGRKAPW